MPDTEEDIRATPADCGKRMAAPKDAKTHIATLPPRSWRRRRIIFPPRSLSQPRSIARSLPRS